MEYIDKGENLQTGNNIDRDYLKNSYSQEEQVFIPPIVDAYSGINRAPYRHKLVSLMLAEQQGHCCYCMRCINEKDVTIEHMVPQNFDEGQEPHEEYAYYVSKSHEIRDNVELAQDCLIDNTSAVDTAEKMPHTIAFGNLLASCKGILTEKSKKNWVCNTPRSNTRILPLPLMPECADLIAYDRDGTMRPLNGKMAKDVKDTIDVLRLNVETLKEIRKIWAGVIINKVPVADIEYFESVDDKDDGAISKCKTLLFTALKDDVVQNIASVKSKYEKYYTNGFYRKLLSEYNWFSKYYATHL
jgi:hypothetical protein